MGITELIDILQFPEIKTPPPPPLPASQSGQCNAEEKTNKACWLIISKSKALQNGYRANLT